MKKQSPLGSLRAQIEYTTIELSVRARRCQSKYTAISLQRGTESHDGKVDRRTDGGKLVQVFRYAEVIAGIERGSAGRVARKGEGVNGVPLARLEGSNSAKG